MKIFSLLIPLKNNLQFSSKNKILQYASVFLVILAVLFSQSVYSQARAFTNPGLEFAVSNNVNNQADTNFGWSANGNFDAGAAKMSPWYTSHPTQSGGCASGGTGNCHPVEIWGTGFLGVPAAQGTNFVELNAYVPSMIYQNLYLVTGDQITYYFRHRARDSNIEKAAMVIEDQSEVNIATIYTTPSSNTSSWSVNSGVYSYTGPTGLYRVGFRATAASDLSKGNFLDDVRISMNPIIDMKFSNLTTACEGSSHGSIFLRVNGRVNDPTTVAFELINPLNGSPFVTDADLHLTAVANSNGTPVITHTAGTNIYTVTIPIGNYDGGTTSGYSSPTNDEDGIQINVASVNDGAEGKETFKFEIKAQNTNGATNNFVSTSSPVFGDPYVGTTNDGFIEDLDSDGDGVANFCDLDDDNDGILDSVEQQITCNCTTWNSPTTGSYTIGATTTNITVTGLPAGSQTNTLSPGIGGCTSFLDLEAFNANGGPNQTSGSTLTFAFSNPITNPTFQIFSLGSSSQTGMLTFTDQSNNPIPIIQVINQNPNLISVSGTSGNVASATEGAGSIVLEPGSYTQVKVLYITSNGGTDGVFYGITNCVFKDTDGDGIPDYLDLDSDNDGCPDAVEGDENVLKTQLINAGGVLQGGNGINPATPPTSGTFNQSVLENICAGSSCVDAQGVPTRVNSGGSADIGGDQGQGVGSSANAAVQAAACNLCDGTIYLDSDGDGVADTCDLDDDNDGILDVNEGCPELVTFEDNGTFGFSPTAASFRRNLVTVPGAPYAYASGGNLGPAGSYAVVNKAQGIAAHPGNLWFYGGHTTGSDTDLYLAVNGAPTNAVFFRQTFTLTAGINYSYGAWTASAHPASANSPYSVGMRLIRNSDNAVISSHSTGVLTSDVWKLLSTNVTVATTETYTLELLNDNAPGLLNIDFSIDDIFLKSNNCVQDTDGDGIPDYLDLDSDNDGCPDAVEGDENVLKTQLINAGGVLQGGNGINPATPPTSGTFNQSVLQNLCASGTCVDAQGVPTLVNSGGASDIGGDQGQGVGSSANAAVQAPACDLCNGTVYPDADGDGVADSCDLDDDNDGILDTDEGCAPVPGSVGHFFNIPANPFVASFTASLTSVSNIRAGAGAALSYPGLSGTSLSVLGIAETTSAGAIANNDYVEYDLTVGANAITISSIIMRRIGNGYRFALALINNSTTASTTLLSDVSFPLSGTGIGSSNTFAFTNQLLAAGQSYTIRIYLYSATSASRADLDDLYISNSYIFCKDTDGDGIPDSLDLDSDNDGCPDAAEGGNTMIPKTSLVASVGTLQGGNGVNPATPPTSGTFNQAVLLNLGNTVGSTSTTLGVPTIAGTGQSVGSSANAAINACFCYNDPNIASAGANTNHGITLLQRAGADNGNWPMIRKSAHTALESNTKGFVITRMTTAEITAIVSPQEGMMVYDTVAKCLKLYDGTAWSCFVTPTCP